MERLKILSMKINCNLIIIIDKLSRKCQVDFDLRPGWKTSPLQDITSAFVRWKETWELGHRHMWKATVTWTWSTDWTVFGFCNWDVSKMFKFKLLSLLGNRCSSDSLQQTDWMFLPGSQTFTPAVYSVWFFICFVFLCMKITLALFLYLSCGTFWT